LVATHPTTEASAATDGTLETTGGMSASVRGDTRLSEDEGTR